MSISRAELRGRRARSSGEAAILVGNPRESTGTQFAAQANQFTHKPNSRQKPTTNTIDLAKLSRKHE
jgi:hypothetical protein